MKERLCYIMDKVISDAHIENYLYYNNAELSAKDIKHGKYDVIYSDNFAEAYGFNFRDESLLEVWSLQDKCCMIAVNYDKVNRTWSLPNGYDGIALSRIILFASRLRKLVVQKDVQV